MENKGNNSKLPMFLSMAFLLAVHIKGGVIIDSVGLGFNTVQLLHILVMVVILL